MKRIRNIETTLLILFIAVFLFSAISLAFARPSFFPDRDGDGSEPGDSSGLRENLDKISTTSDNRENSFEPEEKEKKDDKEKEGVENKIPADINKALSPNQGNKKDGPDQESKEENKVFGKEKTGDNKKDNEEEKLTPEVDIIAPGKNEVLQNETPIKLDIIQNKQQISLLEIYLKAKTGHKYYLTSLEVEELEVEPDEFDSENFPNGDYQMRVETEDGTLLTFQNIKVKNKIEKDPVSILKEKKKEVEKKIVELEEYAQKEIDREKDKQEKFSDRQEAEDRAEEMKEKDEQDNRLEKREVSEETGKDKEKTERENIFQEKSEQEEHLVQEEAKEQADEAKEIAKEARQDREETEREDLFSEKNKQEESSGRQEAEDRVEEVKEKDKQVDRQEDRGEAKEARREEREESDSREIGRQKETEKRTEQAKKDITVEKKIKESKQEAEKIEEMISLAQKIVEEEEKEKKEAQEGGDEDMATSSKQQKNTAERAAREQKNIDTDEVSFPLSDEDVEKQDKDEFESIEIEEENIKEEYEEPVTAGEEREDIFIVASVENVVVSQKVVTESTSTKDKATTTATSPEGKATTTKEKPGIKKEEAIKFSGKGLPNSFVTLFVYSQEPLIAIVKTDENGNWNYTLKKSLEDGEHKVYAAATNNQGRIVAKSKPFTFFVEKAKAVDEDTYLREKGQVNVVDETDSMLHNYFVYFYIAIALVTLMVIYLFLRLMRQ